MAALSNLAREVFDDSVEHADCHREALQGSIRALFFEKQLHHKLEASRWLGAVKLHVDAISEARGTLYTAHDILIAAAELERHYAELAAASLEKRP